MERRMWLDISDLRVEWMDEGAGERRNADEGVTAANRARVNSTVYASPEQPSASNVLHLVHYVMNLPASVVLEPFGEFGQLLHRLRCTAYKQMLVWQIE